MAEDAQSTHSVGLRTRIRYHFDNLLSRGTWAVLVLLGGVTVFALVISALLLTLAGVTFAGSDGTSFREDFWQSLLRALDPGTMGADVGWGRRWLALLVTIFGILIAGTLIGLIAAGVEQRVEEMQRGRSVVVESGHVVVLGNSARLPVVVNQLTLASRKRWGNAIVILANGDPRELNDAVRSLVTDTRGSRLVFRWGDPTRRSDLALVSVDKARSVIVLADDDAQSDARVVKAVLAVGAELDSFDRIPIIAEVTDEATAESLSSACGGQVHPFIAAQGLAQITAFTLREPGLHQVVEELLDYRGSDIYIRPPGDLAGSSFAESVVWFTKARPIGIMDPDGELELNPAPHTIIAGDDRLVVLADDGTTDLATRQHTARPLPSPTEHSRFVRRQRDERLLILGWNLLGPQLLDELSQIVAPGSSVDVVYDARLFERDELGITPCESLTVTVTPTTTDVWEIPDRARLAAATSIVLLGYRRGTSVEDADSRTLLNLMSLKRELDTQPGTAPRIVAELLNADNVELARITGADDFLVSDAIVSRTISQLAEQPGRRTVIRRLYSSDGASVHLIEAQELHLAGDLGFDEIIDTAYSSGLLAIGWRLASTRGGQMVLNPDIADHVHLEADDHLVVIG